MKYNVNNRIKKKLERFVDNERGTAIIASFLVMTVLIGLTASFTINSVSELNNSNRYRNSAKAFWAAEAGANRFIQNNTILNSGNLTLNIGSGTVVLSKNDSDSTKRVLTVVGTVGGVSRTIQLEFPATPPDAFSNTVSTGGNLTINALFAGLDVNQKTRITGTYTKSGFASSGTFDDKVTGVASGLTTLKYPDANNNGTSDEFNDFRQFNQDLLSTYSPSEVVYVQSNSAVSVYPQSSLVGKKIIYVEGTTAGSGDVNLYFDSTWAANQNVTVISTGSVNYIQPLQSNSANSQLNTVSWDDYNEGSILYSAHTGTTYTHSDANFGSIVALSTTTGSVVANSSFNANLAVAWKQLNYENPIDSNGNVPPGFEGLIGTGSGGYASAPSEWYEI